MRLATVLVLGFAARVASAAPPDPIEEERSPALGVTLSLLGGIAPFALVSVAANEGSDGAKEAVLGLAAVTLVLGPTTGHWYAGQTWTAATSVRLVGVGLSTLAVFGAASTDGNVDGALGLFIVGLGVATGGAIYDVATANDAVCRWNHTHITGVQPTALRLHGGGYGLGLAGTF